MGRWRIHLCICRPGARFSDSVSSCV